MEIIITFSFFSTIFVDKKVYILFGDKMKIKMFDEESEKDLEEKLNDFLSDFDGEIVDIKFQVSVSIFSEEQIYCFSGMIIYK